VIVDRQGSAQRRGFGRYLMHGDRAIRRRGDRRLASHRADGAIKVRANPTGRAIDAVLPFRRRAASRAVIGKLVELGYLRPAKRDSDGVVEHAVQRLRQVFQRDGLICEGISRTIGFSHAASCLVMMTNRCCGIG